MHPWCFGKEQGFDREMELAARKQGVDAVVAQENLAENQPQKIPSKYPQLTTS